MIASLRGRLAHRDTDHVVVDVHGVGYLVRVPDPGALPARGQDVELHTSLQVREDAMTLYGFPDRDTRRLFELLLTSSGVGPKLALAALATHRPDVLRRALADGDLDTLTLVPGIGKKVAGRLVLELKDQLAAAGTVPDPDGTAAPGEATSPLAEVRQALVALGYSGAEAHAATVELEPDGEVGDLLRRALRALSAAPAGAR